MVQYLVKFLPDLVPLHQLLQKEVKWLWGTEEHSSLLVVKEMLISL